MKFNSLSEMLDHFGDPAKMREAVDSWIGKMQNILTDAEYCNHVIIDRDLLIYGFQLREIDAFMEGLLYEKK